MVAVVPEGWTVRYDGSLLLPQIQLSSRQLFLNTEWGEGGGGGGGGEVHVG